jgi:hypothetical protein
MNIRDARRAGMLTLAAPALLVAGVASSGIGGSGIALAADNLSPTAVVADGTLTVTATNGDNNVSVGLGATPSTFVVDFGGGDSRSFDPTSFVSIDVFLGNGDDAFTVPVGHQFTGKRLSVFGENGDDSLLGSDGNDVITGGRGDDVVDGGKGTDTEVLGSGSDIAVWLPGEGSDNVDGGSGTDALNFVGADGAETMALNANGQHAVFTRQPGSVVMDTVGVETLNIRALGGADTITVNDGTGTALDTVNIDLSSSQGTGDNAIDTVTVNGTQPTVHVTGAETTDQLLT